MEIKSISAKIFKTASKNTEDSCNQTNPFGVNFKGNIISADVFETAQKTNLVSNWSEKIRSKMASSAIVGSIGDMSAAISSRLDSVVSFGRRMKENAGKMRENAAEMFGNLSDKLSDKKISLKVGGSESFFQINLHDYSAYKVKNLLGKEPELDIEPLFANLNAEMEAIA